MYKHLYPSDDHENELQEIIISILFQLWMNIISNMVPSITAVLT